MGLGKALSKGFEPFAQVIEHARRHPKAAEFAKALSGALPPDIREGMLAAAEIHVLDDVDKVDAFFEQTGSRTGAAAIWTDGERIVVVARPTATAKDIAEEAIHLEQLFSASKGGAVRELYDAVPDLAAWRALGEAGEYAEQLRLYRLKLDLEIDAHTTIVTRRRALGDLEGVREAEETLGELRKIEARTAAMTGEEAAAAGVLKDEAPWLLAKRRRGAGEGPGTSIGAGERALREGGKVGASRAGGTLQFAKKVSPQKVARHVRGTAPEGKSVFESVDDAQAVLDAYHSGNYRLLSENVNKSQVVIEVPTVKGTYINKNNPNGLPDIEAPTNVFMIQGITAPKPVPVNPNKGL